MQLLLFDAILLVTASAILFFINGRCLIIFSRQTGEHKAWFCSLGQMFGLANDTSISAPAFSGLITKILVDARRGPRSVSCWTCRDYEPASLLLVIVDVVRGAELNGYGSNGMIRWWIKTSDATILAPVWAGSSEPFRIIVVGDPASDG
ncbi:hypothetical protein Pla144_32850 [Bythopirellula polymerisocia]|uniref:Uncharacterized protein n=1 Tax=Bythopirellula polymerisocia TaxID=2528003 RepID=A0A5C6CNV6_9BACT|nr:hypothetical protein Pla144_32850 [Bythopirellula polymerisocia]